MKNPNYKKIYIKRKYLKIKRKKQFLKVKILIIVSLFKTNTPKKTVYGRGRNLSKPRKQEIKNPFISEENKKIKHRIIRDIWTLFETEEEKKEIQESEKRERQNERLIKDKIIRDIRSLSEEEEEESYYKPKE